MKVHVTRAFTLIELLIVVAIIAILAAIAVPNFLEAQTRAKVARTKADMRSLDVGLTAYQLDANSYPFQNALQRAVRIEPYVHTETLERLTTPIAYLTGLFSFRSPFKSTGWYNGGTLTAKNVYRAGEAELSQIYWYGARNATDSNDRASIWGETIKPLWWFTQSAGPEGMGFAVNNALNSLDESPASYGLVNSIIYDPTNGTVSRGGIWRVGVTPVGDGTALYHAVMRSY